MVSTWRFWSGKEINFARSQPFQLLGILAIVVFVLIRFSHEVLFFVGLAYMFSGIWARAAYSWSRRRRQMPRDEDPTRTEGTGRTAPAFTSEYAQRDAGMAAGDEEFMQPRPRFEAEEEERMDLRLNSREDSRPDDY
jgi:hypothetical protein